MSQICQKYADNVLNNVSTPFIECGMQNNGNANYFTLLNNSGNSEISAHSVRTRRSRRETETETLQ